MKRWQQIVLSGVLLIGGVVLLLVMLRTTGNTQTGTDSPGTGTTMIEAATTTTANGQTPMQSIRSGSPLCSTTTRPLHWH